ncbi:MAG: hypothetical protein H6639_14770 [Caldilineaceae bacterium]|nr:hypothetical protein [Caldilineaceae bacterium]
MTFTNWLNATSAQDAELADFYRKCFTNALLPAFGSLVSNQAPWRKILTPEIALAMEEYQQSEFESNQLKDRQRGEAFAIANATRACSTRNTVLFATTLFFDGWTLRRPCNRCQLLGLGPY